jgi:hypothetical protein
MSALRSARDERTALTLRRRSVAKASKGDGLTWVDCMTHIILRGSPKTASTSGCRRAHSCDPLARNDVVSHLRRAPAIPRHDLPGLCLNVSRLEKTGRGECRVPAAPAASCAKCRKHTSVVTTSPPGSPGIPARNGFNGCFVLSPAIGLSCHRRLADTSARLDAGVEASGPHDLAVREPGASRQKRNPRPPHSAPRP